MSRLDLSAALPQSTVVVTADGANADGYQQIAELLEKARSYLRMDVAFVSQFKDGRREFLQVIGSPSAKAPSVGAADPLEETYCARIIDGRLPRAIPDTALLGEAAALDVTRRLNIQGYLSAPILLDGVPWGTVCCISNSPRPDLREIDARALESVARLVAMHLQHSAGHW